MAIDRAGPADTGAEDDTVGDFDNRDDSKEEVTLPSGAMSPPAGVGNIGCTVDGVADGAVVGDDVAVVGGTDGPRAAVAGFETTAADPVARGLSTEAFPSLAFEAGWSAKAEFLSAVIRSYIRLGLVVAGWEDVLVADGEDDVATAEPGTFVVFQGGEAAAGRRIVEDETGDPAIVILVALGGGIVVVEDLVEMFKVGFWTLTAACLPLKNPCVPPGVVVRIELCRPKTLFSPARVPCRGIALPDRAGVACRVGVLGSRCWVTDLLDDGFAFGVSTPPISVS